MDPNTAINWLTWANALHIGGPVLTAALVYLAHLRGWLGTPQGQADLKDGEAILTAALDIAKNSRHPASNAVASGLQTMVTDAQKIAIPPTSAPVIKALSALALFLLLGLGINAKAADPIAGWCAGPSFGGGTTLYQGQKSGNVLPVNFVYGDVAYAFYTGSWTGGVFQPAWFIQIQASLGTDTGNQQTALGASAGYYIDNVGYGVTVQRQFDVGDNPGAMIGFGGNYQFSGYLPFVYMGKPGN